MLATDKRFVTCIWHVIVLILHPAVHKAVFFSGGNTVRFQLKAVSVALFLLYI